MRISHTAERTRRALWVMYTRLTSTRLHKFYTLTLLLTLLPLIILHLLALSNTSTALNKLSLLLSATNSTNANSVVPTVTDQNGQGILQLCNVGQIDCQTVTSVAPTATMTSTPQQVGAGGGAGGSGAVNTVPVNAGAPTNSASATPVPDVAVQPGGTRPAPPDPISSQSGSSQPSASPPPNPPPPQGSDGGVLIAAPPAQTQPTTTTTSSSTSIGAFIADAPSTTSTTASTITTSSSTGAGAFIAEAPSTISTATTSTASTSTLEKSGGGNDKNNGKGQENGDPKTSKTTELTLPPLITLNPGESTTSSEIPSATTSADANADESSSSSTTSAETETETRIDGTVAGSTSSESSFSAPTTSTSVTSSQESTTSTDSSTSTSSTSIATDVPNSTPTSSSTKETDSPSKETETSALSSSILSTTVSSTSSAASSSSTSSSLPSSSVDEAKDEVKDTTSDKQDDASTSQTKESSTPTPTPTTTPTTTSSTSTSKSESESTESTEVPGKTTSTNSPSTPTPNTRFFSLRDLSFQALPLQARAFSATPITNSTTGALDGIDVTDVDDTGSQEVTRLGVVCAIAMAFPRDQLRQEWMENLTVAAFYLGMLGVGIAAILNESVAHLITISLSTLLSLLWTGTQLVRTHYEHDQFDAFITRGACSGIDVLPSYWAQRTRLELPILIINALALLLLGVLGVQLFKRYHREGGRGVGRYLYKVVVILRCAVLLGGFLLAASMGIWVHLLFTNAGIVGASGVDLLKALGVVSLVFVLPWGLLGWLALNAATPSTSGAYNGGSGRWGRWWGKRTMMGFFCGLNVLFLGGWVATFASDVYRAVFLAWTFFAVLSIAGFFVLMGSLGAGVICWMRFARDLQDLDLEKPPRDTPRPFSIASINSFGINTSTDPFGVRPSNHSHSHSGHSHSHAHGGVSVGLSGDGPDSLRWDYSNTAEKAWEPFDKATIRQSQFTASEGRQSTVFSYGLRSPAPPMPTRPEYGSSNNSNVTLGLAL